ncbi:MAG TPA: hypothetical protein VGS19_37740 [Streptosporangiaceae bacterium]|nr:hypothetical protein [Streptosporangiaceae bacterium]
MNLLRRLVADIRRGENIDAYVTVVAAIVLAVLNIIDVLPTSRLSGVILAVLALLAVGTLVTRSRLEAMTERAKAGLPHFSARWGADHQAALDDEGDLYLQGVSLTTTIMENLHSLERRLRLGRTVRVLLIRPESPGAHLAEDRLRIPADHGRRTYWTQSTLDHLARLAAGAGDRLQVRLTEQELSFGAAVVNPGTSRAAMYVQYYAYRGTKWDGMRLLIKPSDEQWYDYHLAQIDELWTSATAWTPPQPPSPTPTP